MVVDIAGAPLDLSDDQISEFINDPAKIETHEIALEVLEVLDTEIAQIQTQIDAATIEANIRPLPESRQDWLRRASYACAMRRNERHRVMQRDKEIRGTKGRAQQSKKDPAVGIAKQERLKAEAEARKAAKLAEAAKHRAVELELAQRKTFNHRFHAVAKQILPPETYAAIVATLPKQNP